MICRPCHLCHPWVLFLLRSSGRLRGCRENTGSSSPRERPPIHHHHHHHHLQQLAPRTQLWGSLRRGRILRTRATILPSPILCLDRNQVCHDLARAMLPRCSEGSPETSVRELEQRTLSGVRGTKNGDGNAVRRIEKASVGRLFVANGERSEVDGADRRTAEWITHPFRIRPHTPDPVLCPSLILIFFETLQHGHMGDVTGRRAISLGSASDCKRDAAVGGLQVCGKRAPCVLFFARRPVIVCAHQARRFCGQAGPYDAIDSQFSSWSSSLC